MTQSDPLADRIRELEQSLAAKDKELEQARLQAMRSDADLRAVLETGDLTCILAPDGEVLIANSTIAEHLGVSHNELIGRSIFDFLPQDLARQRKEQLAHVCTTGAPLHFMDTKGQQVFAHMLIPVVEEGQVARVAVHAEDVSVLMEKDSILDQSRRLEAALFDIVRHTQQFTSMDELFQDIHGLMQRELRAENLFVALIDESADALRFTYCVDKTIDSCPTVENISNPKAKRLSLLPIQRNEVLHLTRTELEEMRESGTAYIHGNIPEVWLGLPLRVQGKPIGVMVVQDYDTPRDYSREDILLLTACADQIALGIERSRTQEALKESEERFRKLYINAPLPYQSLDAQGNILEVNNAYCLALGYTPEELLGMNFSELLPEDWKFHFRENFPRFKAVGEVLGVEFELLKKDGSRILVAFNGRIGRDPDGSFRQTYCVFRDITLERMAENALRESEQRFRRLLEEVDMVAVQGYNEQRKVIFWNKASENLYGYSKAEAMGRQLEDLIIPPPMREYVVQAVDGWVQEDIHIPAGENDLMRKDGSLTPVYSSHVMQENSSGYKEMYCIDVDLSDIHKARAELLKAKEEAEAASKAKSMFLANMSHELRTPLSGIMNMHQLLAVTNLDAPQLEYVETAIQSAQRLSTLLGDILDLSRVEAGKLTLKDKAFSPRELLSHVAQLFQPSCSQKGLALDIAVDESVPELLMGDQTRLQQVLNNLVGNAIKFTRQGVITIQADVLDGLGHDKQRVLFTVADTGMGMNESTLVSLFEPFYQADQGYTRTSQGAGLGLSIVRQLVSLMGGTMAVDSEPGRGTIFYLNLPMAQAPQDTPRPEPESINFAPPTREMNILVVEDEYVNRLSLRRMLEQLRCRVTLAENGEQALALLQENSFQMVFMDIQMPVMNGMEATRAIRQGEAGQDKVKMPVIALTAYAMERDKQNILESGVDDYLIKPVEMSQLTYMLARFAGDSVEG